MKQNLIAAYDFSIGFLWTLGIITATASLVVEYTDNNLDLYDFHIIVFWFLWLAVIKRS